MTEITGKIIDDMTLTYDHTQDYYYLKGIAAGEEKAQQEREKARQEREKAKQEKIESIQALLTIGNLSHTQIADIMKVAEKFVEQIANEDLGKNE